MDMVDNQNLFITHQRYIGMGPRNITVGDEVWVLFGGRVPFMSRPLKRESIGVEVENQESCWPHYLFLGDCYVHGITQGEAMNGYEAKSKTITLH